MCRAGDAYWTNTEPATAKSLLEQGIADLESAGLHVEAAGHRILLGRCYWELNRPDVARTHFERAKEVLEAAGPSEALAVAYIRLAGLSSFDMAGDLGLADALRAAEIARQAGSSMALAWSWNFVALAKCFTGHNEEGFRYMEDSYRAAVEGNHYFPASNAIFNGTWLAIHLGDGRAAGRWLERARGMPAEAWPVYLAGVVALRKGQVSEAVALARSAVQKAKDAGNTKNEWRGSVLLAEALAEALMPQEAAAELPPVSSRVEAQDVVYDLAARVRTLLASGDAPAALEMVRGVDPRVTGEGSPAEVVAEAAQSDPPWLRQFVEHLPNQDADPPLVLRGVEPCLLGLALGLVVLEPQPERAGPAQQHQQHGRQPHCQPPPLPLRLPPPHFLLRPRTLRHPQFFLLLGPRRNSACQKPESDNYNQQVSYNF